MSNRERKALEVSFHLLKHYATILNEYDGGFRQILEKLENWIDKANKTPDGEYFDREN